jgi:hypothetical protein
VTDERGTSVFDLLTSDSADERTLVRSAKAEHARGLRSQTEVAPGMVPLGLLSGGSSGQGKVGDPEERTQRRCPPNVAGMEQP